MRDRIRGVETLARSGRTFCEKTSAVSHEGLSDSFHDARAKAWLRADSACFARDSGLRAAIRPICEAFMSRSVALLTAQLPHS